MEKDDEVSSVCDCVSLIHDSNGLMPSFWLRFMSFRVCVKTLATATEIPFLRLIIYAASFTAKVGSRRSGEKKLYIFLVFLFDCLPLGLYNYLARSGAPFMAAFNRGCTGRGWGLKNHYFDEFTHPVFFCTLQRQHRTCCCLFRHLWIVNCSAWLLISVHPAQMCHRHHRFHPHVVPNLLGISLEWFITISLPVIRQCPCKISHICHKMWNIS